MSAYLIIFGAAVRADGTPSGTLSRRVAGALKASKGFSKVKFLATGGAGKNGIVEAEVIKSLLVAQGVDEQSIIVEPLSTDTFQSIVNCDALLRNVGQVDWVAPCTSRYHMPRCKLLLRLLGWRVRDVRMPSDWGHVPPAKLLSYYLKELASTPYDLLLTYMLRRERREVPG